MKKKYNNNILLFFGDMGSLFSRLNEGHGKVKSETLVPLWKRFKAQPSFMEPGPGASKTVQKRKPSLWPKVINKALEMTCDTQTSLRRVGRVGMTKGVLGEVTCLSKEPTGALHKEPARCRNPLSLSMRTIGLLGYFLLLAQKLHFRSLERCSSF